jgi:hypothetical protein
MTGMIPVTYGKSLVGSYHTTPPAPPNTRAKPMMPPTARQHRTVPWSAQALAALYLPAAAPLQHCVGVGSAGTGPRPDQGHTACMQTRSGAYSLHADQLRLIQPTCHARAYRWHLLIECVVDTGSSR